MALRSARRKALFGGISAFARKELVTLVAVFSLLGCLGFLELDKARNRSRAICCNCNLKQIGLSFRTWALDHGGTNPMDVPIESGGTREYLASGEVFRHFQVMSNELSTPKILVCPKRRSQRGYAGKSWPDPKTKEAGLRAGD